MATRARGHPNSCSPPGLWVTTSPTTPVERSNHPHLQPYLQTSLQPQQITGLNPTHGPCPFCHLQLHQTMMITPTPSAPEEHDGHPHFQLHQIPVVTANPIVPPGYSGQLLKVQQVSSMLAPQQPVVVSPTLTASVECGGQQYLKPYQTDHGGHPKSSSPMMVTP